MKSSLDLARNYKAMTNRSTVDKSQLAYGAPEISYKKLPSSHMGTLASGLNTQDSYRKPSTAAHQTRNGIGVSVDMVDCPTTTQSI